MALSKKWRFPMTKIKAFMNSEKGAALVEYGILVGLIAVLAIAAVLALGEQVRAVFNNVDEVLSDAIASSQTAS